MKPETITDTDIEQYDRDGFVMVDTPFTPDELDRAEAAWDRWADGGRDPYEEPGYVDMIQHPFFEAVAGKVLRSDRVHLWWGLSPIGRMPEQPPYPDPCQQWARECHVDIQATLTDFEATPRRMRAELWLWLNDVPASRGAMRILPGSHRPIMAHWDTVLRPDQKAMLPRVHGLCPAPLSASEIAYPEGIPDLSDIRWIDQGPVPAVARRGQMLILCSAGLHSAWKNEDTVPRKSMGVSWVAAGVRCGLPRNQREDAMHFLPALKQRLRPERAHIVSNGFDWLFESDYEPKWPETFLSAPGNRDEQKC